jgi:hypothetical protein
MSVWFMEEGERKKKENPEWDTQNFDENLATKHHTIFNNNLETKRRVPIQITLHSHYLSLSSILKEIYLLLLRPWNGASERAEENVQRERKYGAN